MSPELMRDEQAERFTMTLAGGQAGRLPAADHARWLLVLEGRAWLTLDGELAEPADDHWLGAGDGWRLPPGVAAVVEGEPRARLALVECPRPPARQGFAAGFGARWRALAGAAVGRPAAGLGASA